jgi:hypothetical protein
MIKVKGIGDSELSWNYEKPPKTFRKVASKADADGNFAIEVYKLKSFNKITKEAIYKKAKDEKVKALEPLGTGLGFAALKQRNKHEEEEF